MIVCLLRLGADRFELYAEPPEEPVTPPEPHDGRLRRWAHSAAVRWRELVETSQRGDGHGRIARWRNAAVCHLAESIAEQRTLWTLRKTPEATLLFPGALSPEEARRALDGALTASRWHHGLWLAIDGLIFAASAVLAPIPGPNAIAYYLAFRVVGHAQSCLGAHRGLRRVRWTLVPNTDLAELASLVTVARADRASRVAAIAARLQLHRLEAYFERVTQ